MNVYISDECRKDIFSFVYDQWGDKDYEATVRRDWEKMDEPIIDILQSPDYADKLREAGVKLPTTPEDQKIFLNVYARMQMGENPDYILSVLSKNRPGRFADSMNIKTVKSVLIGFPDDVVQEVSNIFDSHFLEGYWPDHTYMHHKLTIGFSVRTDLNKTRKILAGQVKRCEETGFYPQIIIKTLTDSFKLVTAYRDLLNSELKKSRYMMKPTATEYKQLTSRDEWTAIITDLYKIFASKKKQTNRGTLQHGDDKAIQDIIANLLSQIYPWCWGRGKQSIDKASIIVKNRLYPK